MFYTGVKIFEENWGWINPNFDLIKEQTVNKKHSILKKK